MRPFLDRCESKKPGSYHPLLSQYLTDLAANDLQLVFKVFEASKTDQPVIISIVYYSDMISSKSWLFHYKPVATYSAALLIQALLIQKTC